MHPAALRAANPMSEFESQRGAIPQAEVRLLRSKSQTANFQNDARLRAATSSERFRMIAIMWQFDVTAGRESDFEQLYGVDGDWTALNRRTRSYLGTSFLRDQSRSSRYIVIEYWSEMIIYEQNRASRASAIGSLEERSAALVDSVVPLGVFTALDVPDRTGPTWSQR